MRFHDLTRPLRYAYNRVCYADKYAAAVKDGRIFPGFRLFDFGRDYIDEGGQAAFIHDRLRDRMTLIYPYRGSFKSWTMSVDALRAELRNYAISNDIQINQLAKASCPEAHRPLQELMRCRLDIERTLEVFYNETRLRVDDPGNRGSWQKYRHDLEFAAEVQDRAETPWNRGDDLIALQKSLEGSETAATLPDGNAAAEAKTARRQVHFGLRLLYDKVLRN